MRRHVHAPHSTSKLLTEVSEDVARIRLVLRRLGFVEMLRNLILVEG